MAIWSVRDPLLRVFSCPVSYHAIAIGSDIFVILVLLSIIHFILLFLVSLRMVLSKFSHHVLLGLLGAMCVPITNWHTPVLGGIVRNFFKA